MFLFADGLPTRIHPIDYLFRSFSLIILRITHSRYIIVA